MLQSPADELDCTQDLGKSKVTTYNGIAWADARDVNAFAFRHLRLRDCLMLPLQHSASFVRCATSDLLEATPYLRLAINSLFFSAFHDLALGASSLTSLGGS